MMQPPCRDCQYRDYPKMGRFVYCERGVWHSTKEVPNRVKMTVTPKRYQYFKNREMKENPCYWANCDLPRQYAEWISSHFVTAPGTGEHISAKIKLPGQT